MKVKEVKLVFKDENKKDLISDTILIKEGMNWLMIEKLLGEFFEKHTGKKDTVSAAIITNRWMIDKVFPDGIHFFLNWENDFGWCHAYLYRDKTSEKPPYMLKEEITNMEDQNELLNFYCNVCTHSIPVSVVECREIKSGIRIKPDTCPSCLLDQQKMLDEISDSENDFY